MSGVSDATRRSAKFDPGMSDIIWLAIAPQDDRDREPANSTDEITDEITQEEPRAAAEEGANR